MEREIVATIANVLHSVCSLGFGANDPRGTRCTTIRAGLNAILARLRQGAASHAVTVECRK